MGRVSNPPLPDTVSKHRQSAHSGLRIRGHYRRTNRKQSALICRRVGAAGRSTVSARIVCSRLPSICTTATAAAAAAAKARQEEEQMTPYSTLVDVVAKRCIVVTRDTMPQPGSCNAANSLMATEPGTIQTKEGSTAYLAGDYLVSMIPTVKTAMQ
jgi:hypothetical protein